MTEIHGMWFEDFKHYCPFSSQDVYCTTLVRQHLLLLVKHVYYNSKMALITPLPPEATHTYATLWGKSCLLTLSLLMKGRLQSKLPFNPYKEEYFNQLLSFAPNCARITLVL